jgi:hypothetical protein
MLDFPYLSDDEGRKPSFAMDYKTINKIENCFFYLKEKTGIYIDPYGRTRVYPDHQRILINYLKNTKDKEVIDFINFLTIASNEDEVIIADGD